MHAVILAAGEGSRLGPTAADVPKAFMSLDGRTLYDRQRDALDGHVDGITVVLGYAAHRVIDRVGGVRTVVLEDWDEYENAESLRRAIDGLDDDVLVLNGDVIVTDAAVATVCDRHATSPTNRSAVAAIPGVQTDSTAIRCDDDGLVTEYGLLPGHRHAGLGIVDRDHLDAAGAYLAANRTDWYPGIYTVVPTEMVAIPETHQVEINYPRDVLAARTKLPLDSADGLDLQT